MFPPANSKTLAAPTPAAPAPTPASGGVGAIDGAAVIVVGVVKVEAGVEDGKTFVDAVEAAIVVEVPVAAPLVFVYPTLPFMPVLSDDASSGGSVLSSLPVLTEKNAKITSTRIKFRMETILLRGRRKQTRIGMLHKTDLKKFFALCAQ